MAAIGYGLLAAAAHAAPTWTGGVGLATKTAQVENAVTADSAGNLLIVWLDGGALVQAADRAAGRSYGTPRALAETPSGPPAVALNGGGDGFAAWCEGSDLRIGIRAAGRLFNEDLDALGTCDGSRPAVAVGPNRRALVAWVRNDGCARARDIQVNGIEYQTVGPEYALSCAVGATDMRVAQNGRGDAAVLYRDGNQAFLATRQTSGSLPAAADVSAAAVDHPAVAVAGDGTVTAVWRQAASVINATTNPAGTVFTEGDPISGAGAGPPDVTFDPARAATTAWADAAGVRTATKPAATDTFGGPQTVPGSGGASTAERLDIEAGPGGQLLLIFKGADGRAHSARREPGAGFGAAAPFSGAGEEVSNLDLAMDGGGNGAATLSGRSGATYTLRAAGYDAAPPTLRSVAVPPSGVAGQALTFAVSPFDVWSAVTTTWNFGDGATAGGTTVSHAYGAAGAYAVTVTGADAFGNATSAQRAVQVAPAPVPDSDGDGFRDDQDCQPANPRVHPGAIERPENGRDENCDGRDAKYPRIDPPAIAWAFSNGLTRFRLTRVQFTDIPRGTRAQVRCTGPRCSFKKTKFKRAKRTSLNLLPLLKGKRNFRPGQRLEVRAVRSGYMGRVVRVPLKAGKIPKSKRLCLKPGTKKPRKCR